MNWLSIFPSLSLSLFLSLSLQFRSSNTFPTLFPKPHCLSLPFPGKFKVHQISYPSPMKVQTGLKASRVECKRPLESKYDECWFKSDVNRKVESLLKLICSSDRMIGASHPWMGGEKKGTNGKRLRWIVLKVPAKVNRNSCLLKLSLVFPAFSLVHISNSCHFHPTNHRTDNHKSPQIHKMKFGITFSSYFQQSYICRLRCRRRRQSHSNCMKWINVSFARLSKFSGAN